MRTALYDPGGDGDIEDAEVWTLARSVNVPDTPLAEYRVLKRSKDTSRRG